MASIAANVAHSYLKPAHATATWTPQGGAIAAAAFWPVALLISIEVISRVNWPDGWMWKVVRHGGLTAVAGIAAVISYRHMSSLLASYGEDPVSAAIGPLAVDGFMAVCSGALLAIGHVQARQAAQDQLPQIAAPGPPPDHDRMPPPTVAQAAVDLEKVVESPQDHLPLGATDSTQEPERVPVAAPEVPPPADTHSGIRWHRSGPKQQRPHAAGRQGEAQQAYLRSLDSGKPLTGKELGDLFSRGERWGRDRIAETKAPPEPEPEKQPAAAS
ncbi:hypothetical protein [Streptomyces sp. NBC_00620]|uniref:hypothetical protein n=1 Tax=Streptomyces sp. NBC_00620 TaxID=2903666 RepID=UPI0022502A50|nr:hypothetical protein [Streptomyces sp. NBC_00620]MCX4976243.1 hypothetical protein [Streptomyces sp. NBC_00620]